MTDFPLAIDLPDNHEIRLTSAIAYDGREWYTAAYFRNGHHVTQGTAPSRDAALKELIASLSITISILAESAAKITRFIYH